MESESCFALKGGTAINLFYRDLPRLSVDIDLLYLPLDDWGSALVNIHNALTRLSRLIKKVLPDVQIQNTHEQGNALRLLPSGVVCQVFIDCPNPCQNTRGSFLGSLGI